MNETESILAIALPALAGGVLIGLSAALLLLFSGRIAGVSGIFARAVGLNAVGMPRLGAIAFLVGMPLGALAARFITGGATHEFPSFVYLIGAGVLVGVGTYLGSGCTSGHGVCGVSRLSPRSLVATVVFVATGILTVAVMNAFGGAG